jgi:hypothetical protein
MSNKTRQRRGKKQAAPLEASSKRNDATSRKESSQQSTDEKTLSQIFWGHPLIVVLPYVMVPYLIYHAYHYVLLQRPELVSPFIGLRPALAITDPRQVLIVGTMSSGTTQVAYELSTHFGLEVQHEVSDSTSFFCRDGTVSWFHGIRFLPPPSSIEQMAPLCVNFTHNMGFHPRMYAAQSCSSWQTWSACWMKSCFEVLQREWGCTQRPNYCETPFAVNLWQVRHPLRTMESLTAKFCNDTSVHPSFVTYVKALFPSEQERNTCLDWVATYVLEYSQAMLLAHQRGDIDHWYRVEETSPCQVAALAGFVKESSTDSHVAQKCRDNELLQQPMVSTQYKINQQNATLTLSDFPNEYARRIKKLIQVLGYTKDDK